MIETSAALCSVAIGENGHCVAYKESAQPRSHAAMTAELIDEMLKERGLRIQDCDAVCVSKGPGSYTGLRVGVSSAKGLCFGAGLPLLAVGTLDILVAQGGAAEADAQGPAAQFDAIIPVIDARRDEVYTAVFIPETDGSPDATLGYKRISPVRALIVGQDSFDTDIDGRAVLFIGDASDKCRRLLTQTHDGQSAAGSAGTPSDLSRCRFVQTQPRADAMAALAQQAFARGSFEDVAYFEPFYLKDFVATTPKKLF